MNVSRLLFSITILLTYPIECFVCREVILNLLYGNDPGNNKLISRKNLFDYYFISLNFR